MKCEICFKGEGEWQCQKCRRVICETCARPTNEGVFCKDCLKDEVKPEKKYDSYTPTESPFKGPFLTLLFLSIGLGIILFIGLSFIKDIPGVDSLGATVESLKQAGYVVIGGVVALTVLLGLAYFISTRKKVL